MNQRSHTKMSPATLEALRGSIRKWEGIVAGTEKDRGADNCPLCQKFNRSFNGVEWEEDEDGLGNCRGCPVAEATGEDDCGGSPYSEGTWINYDTPSAELAKAELEFLKSLLPPEAQSDEEVSHD